MILSSTSQTCTVAFRQWVLVSLQRNTPPWCYAVNQCDTNYVCHMTTGDCTWKVWEGHIHQLHLMGQSVEWDGTKSPQTVWLVHSRTSTQRLITLCMLRFVTLSCFRQCPELDLVLFLPYSHTLRLTQLFRKTLSKLKGLRLRRVTDALWCIFGRPLKSGETTGWRFVWKWSEVILNIS